MECVACPHIDNDETVLMKLFTPFLTPERALFCKCLQSG